MKKLPKVGTLVVLKKSSELVNDVAAYFERAVASKTHRTFRVVKVDTQLTLSSVLDSDLLLTNVYVTEVKKL